jgi:hypothetical protein
MVNYFIQNKKDTLRDDQINSFILFAFKNDGIIRYQLLDGIFLIAKDRKIDLVLGELEWQHINSTLFSNDDFQKMDRTIDSICFLFGLLSDTEKKAEISKFISDSLTLKFDVDIYYQSVIFNIIPARAAWSEAYFQKVIEVLDKGQGPRFLERKTFYTDHRIDEYINFAFKLNIEFTPAFLGLAANLGNYYSWITDINNYDYKEFDTDWLYNYYTKYYKKHYKSSITLKEHLLMLCRQSDNPHLLRLFIDVYNE